MGFCLRSRKIALGSGAIDALKGGVFLLIADATAAKIGRASCRERVCQYV